MNRNKIFLFILIFSSLSYAGYLDHVKAYWRFNDSNNMTLDTIGGNNAHCTNCPVAETGVVGNGGRFNGTNTKMIVPSAVALRPAYYTLCMWIKAYNAQAGTNVTVIKHTPYSQEAWGFFTGMGTWASTMNINSSRISYGTGVSITVGQWYFLTATYDGSYFDIYVDTVRKIHYSGPGVTTYAKSDSVMFGWEPGAATLFINATYDEVALFDTAYGQAVIDSFYLRSLAGAAYYDSIHLISISSPSPSDTGFFQRDSGKTYRTLLISGTHDFQTPDSVVISYLTFTGDTLKGDTTANTLTSSTWSGFLKVDCGGGYKIKAKLYGGGIAICSTYTTKSWYVGSIFISAGQSNAAGYGESPYTAANSKCFYWPCPERKFKHMEDPTHLNCSIAGYQTLASMYPAFSNMASIIWPIAIIPAARHSIPLVGSLGNNCWIYRNELNHRDTTSWYGRMIDYSIHADSANGVEGIIWYGGESDAGGGSYDGTGVVSKQQWIDSMQHFIESVREDLCGTPKFYICQIGRYGVDKTNAYIKEAQSLCENVNDGIYLASVSYNFPFKVDTGHINKLSQDTTGMRVANTFLYSLGLRSTYRSPKIVKVWRVSGNQSLHCDVISNTSILNIEQGFSGFKGRKVAGGEWINPDSGSYIENNLILFYHDSIDTLHYAYEKSPLLTSVITDGDTLPLPLEPVYGLPITNNNFYLTGDTSIQSNKTTDTLFWQGLGVKASINVFKKWTINKLTGFGNTPANRDTFINVGVGKDTIVKPKDTVKNVFCRNQVFPNHQYLSELTGGGDNIGEYYLSYDSVIIRDWFKQSEPIHSNKLHLKSNDSSYFTDTIYLYDTLIYQAESKISCTPGAIIAPTPGHTLHIWLNGNKNTPRILKRKVRWH